MSNEQEKNNINNHDTNEPYGTERFDQENNTNEQLLSSETGFNPESVEVSAEVQLLLEENPNLHQYNQNVAQHFVKTYQALQN
ncbi:11694_t:CDS:2, partial [Ambispora leptoticha]